MRDRFEKALRAVEPLEALRAVALELLRAGVERDAILAELERLRPLLVAAGREADEDLVLELMDHLTGFCHPDRKLPPEDR